MKANILRIPAPPRKRHEGRAREELAGLRADMAVLKRLLHDVLRALPPDPFEIDGAIRDEQ